MSKEEFLALPKATEELYNALQNSKSGWISIRRVSDGTGDCGTTEAFGEGISCHIHNFSTWYETSPIQSIDWENHTFKTINSEYAFDFKTLDELNKYREEESTRIMKLIENEGKSNK